jgi:hypothetical protein
MTFDETAFLAFFSEVQTFMAIEIDVPHICVTIL